MRNTLVIRATATAFAFVGGLTIACRTQTSPNPDHCYYAAGDQTCAVLFGGERPYCVGPGESCEGVLEQLGCVVELPPEPCYSPCGGGLFAAEDSSCSSAAEDAEAEGGEGDGSGDGDGEAQPVCGDGVVAGDEECDDGNTVDDDECSNACRLASCGDGIVQSALAETCDDGNTVGGDACTANCEIAGTVIWSRTYDFDPCRGHDVVLSSTGNIVVSASCDAGWRLLGFDPDGELVWNRSSIQNAMRIAIGPKDELAVGGSINDQGQLRYFDSEGNYVWSDNVPAVPSAIRGVAFDDAGNVYGAGHSGPDRMLRRYLPDGTLDWTVSKPGSQNIALVTNSSGTSWALWLDPLQLQTHTASGEPGWLASSLGPSIAIADVAIDSDDNAYVVGQSNLQVESFYLTKIDAMGDTVWTATHDDAGILEVGFSVAALPNGGALVAGCTNGDGINQEQDGLLSWFGQDGALVHEVWFDGEQNNDVDILQGVAVSEGYAVAVGYHSDAVAGEVLWLVAVAI